MLPVGTQPFRGISPAKALARVREVLAGLHIPEITAYGTHDFRRGHAKDLQESGQVVHIRVHRRCTSVSILAGAPLFEILAAGQWKSPAFMAYLDVHK